MLFFKYLPLILYFMGFFVFIACEPKQTTNLARRAVFWPILMAWFIVKGIVGIMNYGVYYILLIIGFNYKETFVYNEIERLTWGSM